MSYDIDTINVIKCLCGKGKIKQTIKSNEWNQIIETIEIVCNECENKYEVVKEFFSPKPKHGYIVYYCKNKENDEKIKLQL